MEKGQLRQKNTRGVPEDTILDRGRDRAFGPVSRPLRKAEATCLCWSNGGITASTRKCSCR